MSPSLTSKSPPRVCIPTMPGVSSTLTMSPDPYFAPSRNPRMKSKFQKSIRHPVHDIPAGSSRSTESNLVDRTRSSQINTTDTSTPAKPSRLSSRTAGHSVSSDDGDAAPNDAPEAAANASQTTSPPCRSNALSNFRSAADPNNDTSAPSNEQRGADDSLPTTANSSLRPDCTSKHFRVRKITGRDSVDGDTYYVVSWKSSWVPSDLIKTGEDGQERYIKIDGKNWRIAGTIKTKVKKGIRKDLVRWVDDTMEPVKRLRRALSAIKEFELMPRLDRRVVSFDESLIDRTKVLPQSEEDFREAQVHLASTWPMIQPRNDIDLLPAFRQIILELLPKRDDDPASRKTHQRLIDRLQLRRLYWSEEYMLAGRFYECTPPKRNALLLQVVAEGTGDGCCERCVSDTAPFKECVRDTSEDSPWLNGACANCGTAEANSTCCHHIYGTAHLDRGRSKGLTSERLREFINPTRSIELLNRLEFEKDDDSDTYSADSYAGSDTSSSWAPGELDDNRTINDSEDDDQHGESTTNNFWTPQAPSEDESNPPRQDPATDSDDGSGGLFVSPATRSISPFQVQLSPRMRGSSASRSPAASNSLEVTQARSLITVATGSEKTLLRNVTRITQRPSWFDRSSVTMAGETPASKLSYAKAAQSSCQNYTGDSSQLFNHDDMYGSVDSPFLPECTDQNILKRSTTSPESMTTSASRAAAIKSVEVFCRNSPTHSSDMNAASFSGPQMSLQRSRGRKRAASQPSEHEPAAFRSSTGSSRSSRGAFNQSEGEVKTSLAERSSVNAVAMSSPTATKIERGSTHEGCRVNWPCRHPDNATPDDGTLTIVYRDTVDDIYQLTIDEVQYILSLCTCHWANAFTKVWDGWCQEPYASVDAAGELTKPQYLLLYWAERLLQAAKECCPTDPRNRETIIID